ncbi:MAG: 3-deoxy-D-manno-octulosonic acid transferase [Alphaproteobacteria bacterium]|nr:3-deoxy-D-manno-octulosonic acid transferase [Alphaproteobacteria bacterium]
MMSQLYRALTDLGAPVIHLYLRRRLAQGREDAKRFPERLGHASQPRPQGRLIWCHAASVGEAASLLALIERLRVAYPDIHILVTTGTVTSAGMLAGRLPSGVIHQYVPVDRAAYVTRFLDHWKPEFALWVESELWPNMLTALQARVIPVVLLNGRMSDKSFRNWYRVKGWARKLLGAFVLCLTQTEDDRSRFVALGARPARCFGNMKYAAKPLPCDESELMRLRTDIGSRKLWIMASTHRGEEDIALEAHRRLRMKWPDLLTIIVPRHAVRGGEIARRMAEQGISVARRSRGDAIVPETEIYLADTMGELGLFYRLGRIVGIGGSFAPVGGHNLIEAAQLDTAIFFGPHMHNFSDMAREFTNNQAALPLQSANEIVFTIDRLLTSPETRDRYAYAARVLADQKRHILDQIMDALKPWLKSCKLEVGTSSVADVKVYRR